MAREQGGQIGLETVIAIAAVLVIFAAVSALVLQRNSDAASLEGLWEKENECSRIGLVLSQTYNSGEGMSIALHTDMNVYLKGKAVYLNDAGKRVESGVVCSHLADLNAAYGFSGNAAIQKSGGKVVVIVG